MNMSEWVALLGAKREGDHWRAKCPAHEDRAPSLMISEGRKGDTLLHCHAGCTTEAIVAAKGRTMRDLFADDRPGPTRREVATYDYTDEDGTLLYQVVRFDPKDFRQRRPEGTGWSWQLNGTRRVLYRLPEVVVAVRNHKRVWIVEGEKDADAVRALGRVATTNAGGAGKWRPEYSEALRGADVVVIADKDEAGHKHAQQVARALGGIASRIVLREPAVGKDVSDHLAAGKPLGELVAPALLDPPHDATDADGFIRVGDLIAEPDKAHPWVVFGMIPSNGLALVAGKPKAGKSTLARAIGLRVCRGETVLDRETTPGPVLYLGLEDPRQAIKGHFQRMGARPDDNLLVYAGNVPEHAQAWLGEQLAKRDPVLVIIDTMQFFLGVADVNDYAQMVNALRSILALVREKTRAAVLVVHHAGKGDRTGFDAILGSTAILGTVDTAVMVKRRPDDQTRTIATMQRWHAPGGEDMPETVLTLDDHAEPMLAGTRAEYDLEQMEAEITACLDAKAASEWTERADVLAAVEGAGQLKVKALDALFRSGHLEREGKGQKGSPFLFRTPRTASGEPKMPFCRSTHTVRTAERHPETVASEGAVRPNSVLPFSGLGEAEPEARTASGRLCPKGHAMTHLVGCDAGTGWVCGTCYPAAVPSPQTAGQNSGRACGIDAGGAV